MTRSIPCTIALALSISSVQAAEPVRPSADITKLTIASPIAGVVCPISVRTDFAARVGQGGYSVGPYYLRNFRGAQKGDDPEWLEGALQLTSVRRPEAAALKLGIKLSFGWACVLDNSDGFKSAFFFGFYDDVCRSWAVDFATLGLVGANLSRERAAYKIFSIQAKNSTGAVITEDDLIGEPNKRVRRFSFCLRKPPVALCGSSEQVKRLSDPKSDLEPYALEIVRSIEFVKAGDDALQLPIK